MRKRINEVRMDWTQTGTKNKIRGERQSPKDEAKDTADELARTFCDGTAEERKLLAKIIDMVPFYVALVDDKHQIRFHNKAFAQYFGPGAGKACHMVLRGQNRRDQFVRCRHVALAHAVEGGFAMVREGGQRLEAEHRAGTFQCVQAAEDGIDLAAIIEAARQVEKAGLDLFQQFGRFCPEN